MGHCCCLPYAKYKKTKRKIVVLLTGLDNAGKSTAAKGLAGVPVEPDSVVPTVGFSSIQLTHRGFSITIYDVGGGSQIRDIWRSYYSDVHGIIFVIDSSDEARIDESKSELEKMLTNEKLAGKPVLVLANKQDIPGAMDEIDIVEKLGLERLVNEQKCPTLVEICSATNTPGDKKQTIDPGLLSGYRWLLGQIIKDYQMLNGRVEEDRKKEQERINRDREAWRENRDKDLESVETPIREMKPSNFFRPIDEVIKEKMAESTFVIGDNPKIGEMNGMPEGLRAEENQPTTNSNGINGHAIESNTTNNFASDIREQLTKKGKLQRQKMSILHRHNKISPDNSIRESLPPVIVPGPRGPLSQRHSRTVKALTSPTERSDPWILPPLKAPQIRPLTSRSLGNEGRAWGLNESLEVVLPPRSNSDNRGEKSDSDDVVVGEFSSIK